MLNNFIVTNNIIIPIHMFIVILIASVTIIVIVAAIITTTTIIITIIIIKIIDFYFTLSLSTLSLLLNMIFQIYHHLHKGQQIVVIDGYLLINWVDYMLLMTTVAESTPLPFVQINMSLMRS